MKPPFPVLQDANLDLIFAPPTTLGGYGRRGCQVAENACRTAANADMRLRTNDRRRSGSRI